MKTSGVCWKFNRGMGSIRVHTWRCRKTNPTRRAPEMWQGPRAEVRSACDAKGALAYEAVFACDHIQVAGRRQVELYISVLNSFPSILLLSQNLAVYAIYI